MLKARRRMCWTIRGGRDVRLVGPGRDVKGSKKNAPAAAAEET